MAAWPLRVMCASTSSIPVMHLLMAPLSTYSVASSSQYAFGAGYSNRRNAARGFFRGFCPCSRRPERSGQRRHRGTGSTPANGFSLCTLIGPCFNPDRFKAHAPPQAARPPPPARRPRPRPGSDWTPGRDRGSNAAADPSRTTRLRISQNLFREMPSSARRMRPTRAARLPASARSRDDRELTCSTRLILHR